jgi:hypothetical protein
VEILMVFTVVLMMVAYMTLMEKGPRAHSGSLRPEPGRPFRDLPTAGRRHQIDL